MLSKIFIPGYIQVVELDPIVIADQPGHLLVSVRVEIDCRRCAVATRLLSPGYKGLAIQAAQRLPSVQAQESGTLRQAEDVIRIRAAGAT